jgi:hypothetical protein
MLAGFFELDGVRETVGYVGGADFVEAALKGRWALKEEAQGRAECCSGGVCAGLDEEGDVGAFLGRRKRSVVREAGFETAENHVKC